MKHLHLTRVLAFALALVLLLGCTACGKKTADDTGDTVGQKDTQTTVELDGKFTLNATRCLGACGLAPVMTINEEVYGRLVPDDIPGILAKYKE